MRLLTVFASPFNPQAVQAVADYLGGWSDERAVSAALAGLIDASLLSPSSREGQLRMLAIVRSFAIQRLADAGATHSAHLAHACWTRDLAEKAAVDSTGPQGAAAMARLNQVRADLASALHWTIDCGRLDVAAAIACSVQLCQHWTPDLELSDLIVDVASRCKSAVTRTLLWPWQPAGERSRSAEGVGGEGLVAPTRWLARSTWVVEAVQDRCLVRLPHQNRRGAVAAPTARAAPRILQQQPEKR